MMKDNIYTFLICLDLCITCVILLSKRCCGAHYQYEACEPKNCSNGPNVSFPFYISGVQESYCGYPGFALHCNKDGFPVLQLPENDYLVVDDIFYGNQSFHVHSRAVSRSESDGSNCVPRIRNTTIPAAQFNYVNSTGQLYLFSSCREPLPQALLRYNISCEGENNWDLALHGKDENLRKAMENCDKNVVTPVELDYGYNQSQTVNVREVLRRGFLLHWKAIDCNKTGKKLFSDLVIDKCSSLS